MPYRVELNLSARAYTRILCGLTLSVSIHLINMAVRYNFVSREQDNIKKIFRIKRTNYQLPGNDFEFFILKKLKDTLRNSKVSVEIYIYYVEIRFPNSSPMHTGRRYTLRWLYKIGLNMILSLVVWHENTHQNWIIAHDPHNSNTI